MKKLIIIPVAVALLAASLLATGCSESQAETATNDAEPAPAASYKEGNGLLLSPTARDFVGLATTEVVPRVIGTAGEVPAIPTRAIVRTIKGDFVYVANGEWFMRTAIVLGAIDGEWSEVRDGLYEGDTVVASAARTLWLAELQAVNGGVGCADGH